METARLAVADIVPAPYNPREIHQDALKGLRASIERYGLVQPLIVNKRSRHVVGGNQRLAVVKDMGIREVDVIYVDLTEEEERRLNVTLNNRSIQGEWKIDALHDLLEEFKTDEVSYKSLRLEELEEIKLDPVEEIEVGGDGHEAEDNASELDEVEIKPEESTITRPSDLWSLGDHWLMCGDATDTETLNTG